MTRAALALLAVVLSGCSKFQPFQSFNVRAKLITPPSTITLPQTRDGVLGTVTHVNPGVVEIQGGRKFELREQHHAYSSEFRRDCVAGDQGTALAFVDFGKITAITNFYCDEAPR